jgi:diguanylate cyclase (GGDEF)-like protein/PAS domain S-box-containing protein
MADPYESFTKQELITRLRELQSILHAIQEEKGHQDLLNFPWVGNLGNWYWYVKTNRVIFNDAKSSSLGYSKDEIPVEIGFEFFTEKIHPEDYDRVMDNMRDHLYGRSTVYEATYRIKTKENHWLWFYDRGKITQWDDNGKPEMVVGIVFDITEQKQLETLLQEQNEKLIALSSIDALTGLFNRRFLFERLEYEMKRTHRSQKPLSVILMDIDYFKQVNDQYGHLVGDQVLIQVAKLLQHSVRKTDMVGRYGGEEFLIVLPDCSAAEGSKVAEKIRTAIQEAVFDSDLKITISGGVAEYKDQSIEKLVDDADHYLYEAKRNGRNVVFPLYSKPTNYN